MRKHTSGSPEGAWEWQVNATGLFRKLSLVACLSCLAFIGRWTHRHCPVAVNCWLCIPLEMAERAVCVCVIHDRQVCKGYITLTVVSVALVTGYQSLR